VPVVGSPVALTGTGTAPTITAAWNPTTWAPSANHNTTPVPTQVFTLTNTGTGTLTGIAQGALGGANPLDYTVNRAASTCGPAGGGQMLGQTTLAPGASCIVTVQFTPRTTTPAGADGATLTVAYGPGTHTATAALNGIVNKTLLPAALTFASTARGTTSATQTVTLTNNTGATVTVAEAIGGTNPTYFSRPAGAAGGTCGGTVATGATCTVIVVFSPPATAAGGTAGAKSATVTAGGLTSTLAGTAL
jgi:hypothetical protein